MTRAEPTASAADAPVDALVLAGRRGGETDPLAAVDNVPHKALLTAGGKPLIRRVVDALRQSGRIADIRVAAPVDIREPIAAVLDGAYSFVDPEGSPASTALSAIEAPGARGLLVTTSDHALLSAAMVRRFLAEAARCDAAAACVERATYEARFPGSRRTFIRLKDFAFSGANLFWFAGARAAGLASFWRRIEANRKNPAAMAREIGPVTALSYLLGQMTRTGLEKTIARKTGVDARLIALTDAEAAVDVDKLEDLTLVRSILAVAHSSARDGET